MIYLCAHVKLHNQRNHPMRIVTRPDFDGIVCAVLIYEALNLDTPILWVEPNEIQTRKADIREGDIVANLPLDPRCSFWFDHHVSNEPDQPVPGAFDIAPSAAGLVYTYYRDQGRLDDRFRELVDWTDIIDSADLNKDQVQFPENYPYILLSMTIQNKDYQDIPYWNRLVSLLREQSIDRVMADEQVKERCGNVIRENREFADFLTQYTRVDGGVAITDFRALETVPSGNRFLVYSLFPETVVSARIRYKSTDKNHVLISLGHSIFNRNCRVNVGHLLSRYGGGGHAGAGGCTLDAADARANIDEILDILRANQPLPDDS